MIARISSKGEQGFYALHRAANGDWVPLSGSPETSSDGAIRRCADHVCDSLERLRGDVSRRIQAAHDNMARLMDHPATADSVVIAGVRCTVEPGGVIIRMPPGPAAEAATRGATGTEARSSELGEPLSERLTEVLSRALNLEGEAEPGRVLADCALNTPLDVLAAAAGAAPSLLGEAAAFLVHVHTRRSQLGAGAPAATPKPTQNPSGKPSGEPGKKPGRGPG